MALRHLARSATCAASIFLVAVSTPADERTETQRWAIVAANGPQETGLVDLLTATLSQDESFELVERADVARVLDELSIQAGGLVDPKQAARFGGLLSANAILVIEKAMQDDEAWLQARLVETRSGIRLWSGLVPPAADDDAGDAIVNQLRTARRKMEPDAERRYVGILDITSEDLDGTSDIFATTTRLMLEHDLHQSPQIVVLEREQASRLLEERDLSGIEVELRAATTLIEGGVRRVAASGDQTVSLRFISPATGVAKSVSVVTPADDWDRVRRLLSRACLQSLTTSREADETSPTHEPLPVDATHGDEAALFRIRSEWRGSHREIAEAAALAEVAFALEPSQVNCRWLLSCHGGLLADQHRNTMERLRAALRYQQIANLYLERGIHEDARNTGLQFAIAFGGDYKPTEMSSAEKRVFEETRRLRQSTFERVLAARRAGGDVVVWFFVHRIDKTLYMADSAEGFVADLRSLITELDRETAAGRFERTMANGYFKIFFGNLQQQIQLAGKVIPNPTMRRYGHLALPGDWGVQGIRPLLEWLVQHEDPRTRMLGHYGLCDLDGDAGASAARTVLDMWINDLTEDDAGGRFLPLLRRAIERLRQQGQFEEFVDQRIQAAEQSDDLAYFCKWNSLVRICRLNMHPQKTTQWVERIKQFIDGHQVADAALARRIQSLSQTLEMDLDRRYRRGDFAPKTDAGSAEYDAQRLPVRVPKTIFTYMLRVAVDQDTQSDRPIVVVWRSPNESGEALLEGSSIIVTRLGLRSGAMAVGGHFHKPGFSPTCLTVDGDDVFIGDRKLGIAHVGPQGVRHFGHEEGLPQAEVEGLAWLHPYLYVGYTGAIGRLNPQSGEFCLLASSRTVQSRNPLDGGRRYGFLSSFSDQAHGCIWISIRESVKGYGRSGIWKYTPRTGQFQHVVKGLVHELTRTNEGFLSRLSSWHWSPPRWFLFDTETEECRTLKGIGSFSTSGIRQPPGWVYLDGGVVGGNGRIYTPDGDYGVFGDRGGWKQPIDCLGRGVVAVSFDRRAFWYIEPKRTSE